MSTLMEFIHSLHAFHFSLCSHFPRLPPSLLHPQAQSPPDLVFLLHIQALPHRLSSTISSSAQLLFPEPRPIIRASSSLSSAKSFLAQPSSHSALHHSLPPQPSPRSEALSASQPPSIRRRLPQPSLRTHHLLLKTPHNTDPAPSLPHSAAPSSASKPSSSFPSSTNRRRSLRGLSPSPHLLRLLRLLRQPPISRAPPSSPNPREIPSPSPLFLQASIHFVILLLSSTQTAAVGSTISPTPIRDRLRRRRHHSGPSPSLSSLQPHPSPSSISLRPFLRPQPLHPPDTHPPSRSKPPRRPPSPSAAATALSSAPSSSAATQHPSIFIATPRHRHHLGPVATHLLTSLPQPTPPATPKSTPAAANSPSLSPSTQIQSAVFFSSISRPTETHLPAAVLRPPEPPPSTPRPLTARALPLTLLPYRRDEVRASFCSSANSQAATPFSHQKKSYMSLFISLQTETQNRAPPLFTLQ